MTVSTEKAASVRYCHVNAVVLIVTFSVSVPSKDECPQDCTNGNGVCNGTCSCHPLWTNYDCSVSRFNCESNDS
jgi:hypothetical protein